MFSCTLTGADIAKVIEAHLSSAKLWLDDANFWSRECRVPSFWLQVGLND